MYNNCICEMYRERLKAMAEPEYAAFAGRLIPEEPCILGVRLPKIRALARELSKDDWRSYFEECSFHLFEEKMLRGMAIGCLKEDSATVLLEVRKFLPLIDNWSICDSFCAGLKRANKERREYWELIQECAASGNTYYIRFSLVMLLMHFTDDEYIHKGFSLIDDIHHEDYYVKMAAAWALSVFFVKHRDETLKYLQCSMLDDFTYNKALQKICESRRVDEREKLLIKGLRRG